MIEIRATQKWLEPPTWAVLERHLLHELNAAVEPYLAKYTLPDGSLRWGATGEQHGRDDVDDFYEAFYNFPLLYLLGGDARLLELSHKHWEATTRQLTQMGLLEREFERGADHFHQGESLIYFYFLCLADPENPKLLERAERFARFYTGADPLAPNYDPLHKIVRAPHNGSLGPKWGYSDLAPEKIVLEWHNGMEQFGLPFSDVKGAQTWAEMMSPTGAMAMGQALQQRFGRGDVSTNLCVTSLVTNAFLMTQKPEYQNWVLEYVSAWQERAATNHGFLPDNVGPNGIVGEDFAGRWYGGLYGWMWPHGFYNVGMSATIAASNAFLLSRENVYLDLARWQMDGLLAQAKLEDGSLKVPYRINDTGWFDWQTMPATLPVALWNISQQDTDVQRVVKLENPNWQHIEARRGKEDAGHEANWWKYLRGELPNYPETMLRQAIGHVARKLEQICTDDTDLENLGDKNVHLYVHVWQLLNPVTTEALVQLTLGAPQHIYNGGLLHARVRYFDADAKRAGLPENVAALVHRVLPDHTSLSLVNLSSSQTRKVIVQAGAFAEHRWGVATFFERTSPYPNPLFSHQAPEEILETRRLAVNATHFLVELPPATQIRLELETLRYTNLPNYATPFTKEVV